MKSRKDVAILVVEDSFNIRSAMVRFLRENGYTTVHTAGDGQEALGVLRNEQVDLVVSDWDMPNVSGLDLLKRVRSMAPTKGIPFLMVTMKGTKQEILDAIQAGVSDYMVKPFSAQTLINKVNKILSKHNLV